MYLLAGGDEIRSENEGTTLQMLKPAIGLDLSQLNSVIKCKRLHLED
jgi:hypothetical protein